MKHLKASLLTLAALMLAPAIANAIPETEPHWSLAGLVGYGFDDGSDGNVGLGLRGGHTLRQNVYLGGHFMYYFEKGWVPYQGGVEGGYDFQLEPVMIRPYVGVGFAHSALAGSSRGISGTWLGFWFGGTVLFNLTEHWFIGGDFKLSIFNGDVTPTPSFTGGLNF
jgi:hypothetical protein